MTLPNRAHRRPMTLVAMALVVAMAALGCGHDGGQVGSGTTVDQTAVVPTTAATTTVTTPTATAQLQPFIDLAAAADRDLAEAAQRINAAATADTITYDQRTVELLDSVSIKTLGDSLPAGMPDELEGAGLLVYSDLVSRWAAMSSGPCPHDVGTRPRSDYDDNHCFVEGARAAARTDGDLADLTLVAGRTPTFTVAAPDSHTAEALAARIMTITLRNLGCASTGGAIATEPIPVVWQPSPGYDGAHDWEGTVDGIQFFGTYDPATGWQIRVNAC